MPGSAASNFTRSNTMRVSRLFIATLALASMAAAAPGKTPAGTVLSRGGNDRCKTLCEAGLGGKPCGCPPEEVTPLLHEEVHAWRVAHPEEHIIYGPRRDLCPSLCEQNLGQPLCRCPENSTNQIGTINNEDWCPICHDILYSENAPDLWMKLGCHESSLIEKCRAIKGTSRKVRRDVRGHLIDFAEGISGHEDEVDWNLWCEVQCDENNGGLACNCDMLPLIAN